MRVSHEVFKSLFKQSNKFNDFDYALVPCLGDEEYINFYKSQSDRGREVWLDNGVFEKGISASIEGILQGICLIRPTHVVAPDVLHNGPETIKNLQKFVKKVKNFDIKVVGVAQGATEKEFINCYREVDKIADVIAIPYDVGFYNKYLGTTTKRYVLARQTIIDRLILGGEINRGKRHHLLGCSDPIEFIRYRDKPFTYDFIESLDTSCPIVAGYNLIELTEEGLAEEKPRMLIAENLDIRLGRKQQQIINKNINIFAKIVGKK